MSDFASPAGKGVGGTVEGRRVVIGSAAFLADNHIETAPCATIADDLRQGGATATFVGVDGRLAGVIGIADRIKATTPAALKALRAGGLRVVMLTGDNRRTAAAIAATLGLDDFKADVLPQDKAAAVAADHAGTATAAVDPQDSESASTSIQWRTGIPVPACRCWIQPMFAEMIVPAPRASRAASLRDRSSCAMAGCSTE